MDNYTDIQKQLMQYQEQTCGNFSDINDDIDGMRGQLKSIELMLNKLIQRRKKTMAFEELTKMIKGYGESYVELNNAFKEESKSARDTYSGGVCSSMIDGIKADYESKVEQLRKKSQKQINEEIEYLNAKVNRIASEPIKADFEGVLNVAKAMKNPTKAEIDNLLNIYGQNYYSYRAICGVFDVIPAEYKMLTIEEVKECIDEVAKDCSKCIDGRYAPTDYMFKNIASGNYWSTRNDIVTSFFDRHYCYKMPESEKAFKTSNAAE